VSSRVGNPARQVRVSQVRVCQVRGDEVRCMGGFRVE
jgi:hypothetical protein